MAKVVSLRSPPVKKASKVSSLYLHQTKNDISTTLEESSQMQESYSLHDASCIGLSVYHLTQDQVSYFQSTIQKKTLIETGLEMMKTAQPGILIGWL
jgi:hypothetical protein